ncbi:ABC transporter ATP-binding protein [Candidatus Nephthysia bennettiae]|uniref:ABC transporter ATP-binding protein n=1 Tax=Candidatus Nephthysia bennettiae TaxID=3127016 RepID=UPI0030C67450
MAGVSVADVLESREVVVAFEGLRAVDGVDLKLARGEILGLIGPNGAGKTTLLNTLSSFQRPSSGRVLLGHVDITGWPVHRVAAEGVGRTFQSGRIFKRLTVFENVLAATVSLGLRQREAHAYASHQLERLDLLRYAALAAGTLPYGLARRLGIARALGLRPRFLLLDEPAAGLNEEETETLVSALRRLQADDGMGLLVIEHDVPMIMRVCDRIHVLDHGRTLAVGTPAQIQSDEAVRAAYLGAPLT